MKDGAGGSPRRPGADTMGAVTMARRKPQMFDPAFPNSVVSDNVGRCVAMVVPQRDSDLPAYRCVRVGVREIDGRLVCEAHGRRLAAIRFCDEAAN
jgi:hypothetical protein